MSETITEAVTRLNAKLGGEGFDGNAKFVIEDEGTILLDQSGARAGEGEADVTLTADAETFRAILDGEKDATAAFMQGQLKVDGDMGQAMKLAGVLS
ncbi:SCP2 sterol-binding domain-containing protein [Wenxinia saemankumensis]|uniref:SCP-2 sterol transfer family protein n=1 Tax=Wenxinia saemankumensis TaxID=1447782 RepID=A0A1M6CK78_9RHOB|nr:SCP2 sterol-binding domain-containing protein [Wenxinia saemankumensis]SHI61422.1 SCP-2 sterol transfer family protein [Wenxinia saemankumensis]